MKKLLLLLIIPLLSFGQPKDYTGEWYDTYANGDLLYKGNYKDGQKDGLWKHYYEGEKLKCVINYKEDKFIFFKH